MSIYMSFESSLEPRKNIILELNFIKNRMFSIYTFSTYMVWIRLTQNRLVDSNL